MLKYHGKNLFRSEVAIYLMVWSTEWSTWFMVQEILGSSPRKRLVYWSSKENDLWYSTWLLGLDHVCQYFQFTPVFTEWDGGWRDLQNYLPKSEVFHRGWGGGGHCGDEVVVKNISTNLCFIFRDGVKISSKNGTLHVELFAKALLLPLPNDNETLQISEILFTPTPKYN